jgi:hypothetical protein
MFLNELSHGTSTSDRERVFHCKIQMKTVYKSVRNKFVKGKTNIQHCRNGSKIQSKSREKGVFIAWKQNIYHPVNQGYKVMNRKLVIISTNTKTNFEHN